MPDTINHKCPFCGATLEFDAASQMVKCPYCDNEFDPESLKGNEGDLQEIELATDGGEEWSMNELYGLSEYQCQSCGGDLYTDANTSATMCPYCGTAVILKGRLSGTVKPDRVIPFKKTKEQAIEGLATYFESKRFVHRKFLQNNTLEEMKGLYVPFWVYDAELDAKVVYNCVNERTWTTGNTEYTERKYYKVTRAGDIAFDHLPVDGSSKMPDDLMESIEPFEYGESVDFTTSYLSGYVADKYDVDQDQARPRAKKRMEEGTADAFGSTVHYDEVNVEYSDIMAKSSSVNYVMYPVWLMNIGWEDKKFTFAMNGQTGKMVGNLPADMVKLGALTAGIFVGIATFISFLYIMLAGGEIDWGVVVGAVILAGIVAAAVYAYYKGQLKTVEFKHGASDYYRPNSMNLTVKEDQFLYKRVTSRRINND